MTKGAFQEGAVAPIVGTISIPHFDDVVAAVDMTLSDEDAVYLEAIYDRHKIVGELPEK